MAKFKSFAKGVEVNGETILSIVTGMGVFKAGAEKILADNGLKDVTTGKWYPQQAWLDAFKTIAQTIGDNTLKLIGQKIPESANFPPGIDSVSKALSILDQAYHMNHRGGEIGHYTFTVKAEREGEMVTTNPYPSAFDLGLIEALANKFKQSGDVVRVVQKGGDSDEKVVYQVGW